MIIRAEHGTLRNPADTFLEMGRVYNVPKGSMITHGFLIRLDGFPWTSLPSESPQSSPLCR
jgi:hypothetical protein